MNIQDQIQKHERAIKTLKAIDHFWNLRENRLEAINDTEAPLHSVKVLDYKHELEIAIRAYHRVSRSYTAQLSNISKEGLPNFDKIQEVIDGINKADTELCPDTFVEMAENDRDTFMLIVKGMASLFDIMPTLFTNEISNIIEGAKKSIQDTTYKALNDMITAIEALEQE